MQINDTLFQSLQHHYTFHCKQLNRWLTLERIHRKMKSLTLVKSVLGASCFDRAFVPGSSQADREYDAAEEIVKRWVAEIVKRTWTEIGGNSCYPSRRILTRASRMLTLRCLALSTALTTSFSEKRKLGCFQSFERNLAKYFADDNTNQKIVKR